MDNILTIDKNKIQRKLNHSSKRRDSAKERLDKLELMEKDGKITLTKYAYFDYLYFDVRCDIFESILEGDYDPSND